MTKHLFPSVEEKYFGCAATTLDIVRSSWHPNLKLVSGSVLFRVVLEGLLNGMPPKWNKIFVVVSFNHICHNDQCR